MFSSLLYITHCQETDVVVTGAVILQIHFSNGNCYIKLQEVLILKAHLLFSLLRGKRRDNSSTRERHGTR